jgi:hypothetical protein
MAEPTVHFCGELARPCNLEHLTQPYQTPTTRCVELSSCCSGWIEGSVAVWLCTVCPRVPVPGSTQIPDQRVIATFQPTLFPPPCQPGADDCAGDELMHPSPLSFHELTSLSMCT